MAEEPFEVTVDIPKELELTNEEIETLKDRFRADFVATFKKRKQDEPPIEIMVVPFQGQQY